jgi:molecular chaperone GrpE
MENHKHEHPHAHKHDAASEPSRSDDAVDLENLKAATAQPQPGADQKSEKETGHKDKDGGAKAKVSQADADAQKQKQEIDELKSKLEGSNDKYLRLMAEFDNFKRRTAKEYQQLIEQANEKLMKDIIDVRENFERAFRHHKEGADPAAFIEGMRMIFTKLDTVLHKHGLEVYCEAGQEFDPELHDAMMKTAHETVPEEHIAEVCEKGYRLKGKVIKHSKVIVSSGKPVHGVAQSPEKTDACDMCEEETVIEVSPDKKPNEPEKKQG